MNWIRRVWVFIAIGVFTMIAGGFVMGWQSAGYSSPGLTDKGELQPCGRWKNCVSSQAPKDAPGFIEPLKNPGVAKLKEAMEGMGATLVSADDRYMAFTSTSKIFRYVDDIEFLIDKRRLHVRSASRVGRNDFGANRKRVEALRAKLAEN